MISSMTGFASTSNEFPGGLLSLELRSVNHRYLDIQIRLPEELRSLEPQLRELISSQASRGKLECRINLNLTEQHSPNLELDQAMLERLLALSQQVQTLNQSARGLSVGELMRWPGVLKSHELPLEILHQRCLDSLQQALTDFSASRGREGEKLKTLLLERITAMRAIIDTIKPKLPLILEAYMHKLSTRLQEVLGNVDDDRLKQELALFAQKMDIDEELTRLTTHLSEVQRVLNKGGQVGKRLDFLMQELNREANTLGSKSVSTETTQASVDLKVLIEQLREQIQNIE